MYGKQPKSGMTLKSSTVSPKGKTSATPKLKQYHEGAIAKPKADAGKGTC